MRQAEALGADVKSDRLNVVEREAVLAYADAVVAHFGTVNHVYNNAGITHNGDVEKCNFKDMERDHRRRLSQGIVNGTKSFLPHLIASGDGHVVNISSLFGLICNSRSKRLQRGQIRRTWIHRGAAQEMLIAKHPVKVTCVHPGFIKTAVARNATVADGEDAQTLAEFFDKRLAIHSPEMAAETIVQRGCQGQRPGGGRLGGEGPRLAGSIFWLLVSARHCHIRLALLPWARERGRALLRSGIFVE